MLVTNDCKKNVLWHWVKGAIAPRLIGISVASLILAYWIYTFTNIDQYIIAIIAILPVSVLLYVGARINLRNLSIQPPSWSKGFFASFISFIACLLILDPYIIIHFGFPFGLFINVAYLGAKIGCMNLGCCGIRSIKKRHLFGWRMRPRLQSFEVVLTLIILLLGNVLYSTDHQFLSGFALIAGHGVLRIFAGTYRFPYKTIGVFLREPSGGGIIMIGLLSVICPHLEMVGI